MRPEKIYIPSEADFQTNTNGDAVIGFLTRDKGEYIDEGDLLVLPDTGQEYWVKARKFYKKRGRIVPSVDFEATCVVPGCLEVFTTYKILPMWAHDYPIRRTCDAHKAQWRTPFEFAWTPSDERAAKLAKRSARHKPKPREVGVVEVEVLASVDLLEPVEPQDLVKAAMVGLRVPQGRDTRRQVTVRAISSLLHRRLLREDDRGRIVLP